MPETIGMTVQEQPTGLEDVARSVRTLARTTRDLGLATTEVFERELAMAISISQQVRDRVIAPETLKRVRTEGLTARFRKDAHDVVDLVADVGGVIVVSISDFARDFIDERRPTLRAAADMSNSALAA